MELFKQEVSYYRNHKDNTGVPVPLEKILLHPLPKHIEHITRIRTTEDEAEQKSLKGELPGFTAAALLYTRSREIPLAEKVIHYTHFMQFDIDEKDNPDMDAAQVRDAMAKIPYVAFVQLSVRGRGVWGLVRVKDPGKLDQYFTCFADCVHLMTGIKLDTSKGKRADDLRYISYDPDTRTNSNPMEWDLVKAPKSKPQPPVFNHPRTDSNDDVILLMEEVINRGLNLLDDYNDWLAVGTALARNFGEQGREYFHALSQQSRKYETDKTDKTYSYWLKYDNNRGDMGAFFNICKLHNIYATELRKLRPKPLPQQPKSSFCIKPVIVPQETSRPEMVSEYSLKVDNATASKLTEVEELFGVITDLPVQGDIDDPFANLPADVDTPSLRISPYPANYNRAIIADVLDNPHNFTTGEALHTILHRVFNRGGITTHAVYDYYKALEHPEPEAASFAALRSFKKWWNWKT